MSTVLTGVQPFAQVEVKPSLRRKTHTDLFRCLVVSDSESRGRMFQRAAADGGWESMVCRDAGQAALQAQRFRFLLVVVDLEGADGLTPEGYPKLSEQLARDGGPLLMICGHEDDALEEIWARQFGAWLYLPGVDTTCDVAMLCREAHKAAEKLHPELAPRPKSAALYARTA